MQYPHIPSDFPPPVVKWIEDFTKKLEEGQPVSIAHRLVQMGIDCSARCGCDTIDFDDPVLRWLHGHHKEYNTAIWRMLIGFRDFQKVRQVILDDLDVPDTVPDSLNEYGHIVLKDYGRLLLDCFLNPTPDPFWVKV